MKRYYYFLALLIPLCLGVLACFQKSGPDEESPNDGPAADPADVQTLVQGNNEFAVELYKTLSQRTEGNIICSPFSISSALAMTYAGARGDTAEQMARTLRFRLDQERLHGTFAHIRRNLQTGGKHSPYRLRIANALWGQRGFPFVESFLQLTRQHYRAGFRDVDFAGNPEKSRRAINQWVEEQTEDKIREILMADDVSSQTLLVLTNAIYFKGTWERPFSIQHTKTESFEIQPGVSVDVNMMHDGPNARHRYFKNEEFQLLELPYKGSRLSMIVLLPRKKGGLRAVEQNLTEKQLRASLEQLSTHDGTVALPRFRIDFKVNLREILKAMGMRIAFSERSDFTGITAGGGLSISAVVHKGFIDVDEKGTEAAAATALMMADFAAPIFELRADHPFLFLIQERKTGAILFAGRVLDPQI